MANSDQVPSTITFADQMTVVLDSDLPAVTAPVTIDGGIAPFQVGVTILADANVQHGLELQAGSDGSVIRNLAFDGFQSAAGTAALLVESDLNTVAGNYFGIEADGSAPPRANNNGIIVSGSNNTIGGSAPADQNVIVHTGIAISIQAPINAVPVDNNAVQGNLIGIRANGAPDGNTIGIQVLNAANTVIGVDAVSEPAAGRNRSAPTRERHRGLEQRRDPTRRRRDRNRRHRELRWP